MIHPKLKSTLHEIMGAPNKQGEVGVELEVEGRRLPTELVGWDWKPENSLRGENGRNVPGGEDREDTPREYITQRPVMLTNLKTKLEYLEKELRTPPRRVILTQRGSTHIHINMGNRTLHNFLGFLLVFTTVEPVLLRLCGPERNGNLFCLPGYETGDMPFFIQNLVRHDLQIWPKRDKYAALNVNCIPSLGSIEVRCFPNSISATDIHQWATWLINIRDIASESDDTFERLMDRMGSERHWLLHSVFGGTNMQSCVPDNPHDLLVYGWEQAHETYHEMQPLFNYKKQKVDKETVLAGSTIGTIILDDPDIAMAFDEPRHVNWGNFRQVAPARLRRRRIEE